MINTKVLLNYVESFSKEIEAQPVVNNEHDACQEVYAKWLEPLQVESVLELGAGVGTLLSFFPPSIYKQGLSLGLEEDMIATDMNTPPFGDNAFYLVIARHAVEHSLIPLVMLCEMARISKRYALVIVPTCTEAMANYQNHYAVFTPIAWKALFTKAGFQLLREDLNVPLYADITEDRFLLEKL